MNKTLIILFCCFMGLNSFAIVKKPLGSKENPIKFSLVPGQDAGVLQSQGEVLVAYLTHKTGLHFKLAVPYNFITVVETIGTKRTDMAMINSFGYLLAEEKYGARVRLMGVSNGKIEYWGQIITAKPEIKTAADLKGKKFAYVDPASTSGFILPSSFFAKKKIQLKDHVFAGKHDSVVIAVYLGQVDGGATFNSPPENGEPQDARRLVKTQYPDVFEKVRILELTGPIPSDPVIFRKEFPPELENKIVDAMISFAATADGPKVLKALYNITSFQRSDEKAFEGLRKMLKEIGKSPEDFVK